MRGPGRAEPGDVHEPGAADRLRQGRGDRQGKLQDRQDRETDRVREKAAGSGGIGQGAEPASHDRAAGGYGWEWRRIDPSTKAHGWQSVGVDKLEFPCKPHVSDAT